jgi:hypothetical protein
MRVQQTRRQERNGTERTIAADGGCSGSNNKQHTTGSSTGGNCSTRSTLHTGGSKRVSGAYQRGGDGNSEPAAERILGGTALVSTSTRRKHPWGTRGKGTGSAVDRGQLAKEARTRSRFRQARRLPFWSASSGWAPVHTVYRGPRARVQSTDATYVPGWLLPVCGLRSGP